MLQSAQEYVRSQQAAYPPRRGTDENVKHVAASVGLDPEEAVRAYRKRDHAQQLLEMFSPNLPEEVANLLEQGQIAVAEIGKTSANAYLETMSDNQYAVLFHSGLSEFVYRVARPVVTAMGNGPTELDSKRLDTPELARTIAEIFWWYQETEMAFGPDYVISKPQAVFASALSTYAEVFLLAHEFGHIHAAQNGEWHEHCDTDLLETFEEHVADMAGLLFVLKAVQEGRGPYPQQLPVAYAGAEVALQIWNIMAQIGMNFVDGIHPPAADRIACLRETLRENCSSDQDYDVAISLALHVESIFAEVAAIIVDPQEHQAAYQRAAESLVDELRELVQRCTGGEVPDYTSFYEEAPKLISQGYPETILDRVIVQIARDLRTAQDRVSGKSNTSENSERTENERQAILQWNHHFQAFKLFFGLTEHLQGPVAEVYRSALDREMRDVWRK